MFVTKQIILFPFVTGCCFKKHHTHSFQKLRATQNLLSGVGGTTATNPYHPTAASSAPPALDSNMEMDPELARYLNRSYWEQQKQQQDEAKPMATTIPSAPASSSTSTFSSFATVNNIVISNLAKVSEKYQNGETDELDQFVGALRSNLEIFVNRMKSNSSRGRSIANDTAVQTLFMNITAMHSQLLKYSQDEEDSRARYEGLQDKLNQIKDARAALDALREDHREKLRLEKEEAERQKQIQMARKLEIMRQKKQNYLEYQRQITMQRMQEQEREMQLRQEQQRQQYMARGVMPPGVMPPPQAAYMPPPPQQQGYSPGGSADGSPVHGAFPPPQGHYPPAPPPQFRTPEYQPYNVPVQGMVPGQPQVTQGPYQNQMVLPPGSIPPQHLTANGPSSIASHPSLSGPISSNSNQPPNLSAVGNPGQPVIMAHGSGAPPPDQPAPTNPPEAELISFD